MSDLKSRIKKEFGEINKEIGGLEALAFAHGSTPYEGKSLNDLIYSFCQKLMEEKAEEVGKILKGHLKYCQEQNGLDYCKNCGLCEEDIELLTPHL